jgi:hypothetical protein
MASQSRLRPCVCRPSVASTFPSRSIRLVYDTRRQSGYGSKPSPPAQGWRWAAVREGALEGPLSRHRRQPLTAAPPLAPSRQRPLSRRQPWRRAPPLSLRGARHSAHHTASLPLAAARASLRLLCRLGPRPPLSDSESSKDSLESFNGAHGACHRQGPPRHGKGEGPASPCWGSRSRPPQRIGPRAAVRGTEAPPPCLATVPRPVDSDRDRGTASP